MATTSSAIATGACLLLPVVILDSGSAATAGFCAASLVRVLTILSRRLLDVSAVVGAQLLARDITFQNTAGPSKHQAVALRVGSDLSAFYQCDMLAYQDTLYVHSLRQFYINCLVAGTVDFIFGNAAAVFQDCDLHARRPNSGQKNMITAQGRDDPNQNTGIVIQKSIIGATSDLLPVQSSFPTYFGRPWKEYSRTIVRQTTISNVINPAGWHEWNGTFALETLFYGEYQNTGPGAVQLRLLPVQLRFNRLQLEGSFKVVVGWVRPGSPSHLVCDQFYLS